MLSESVEQAHPGDVTTLGTLLSIAASSPTILESKREKGKREGGRDRQKKGRREREEGGGKGKKRGDRQKDDLVVAGGKNYCSSALESFIFERVMGVAKL